jgi:hypothetical protein
VRTKIRGSGALLLVVVMLAAGCMRAGQPGTTPPPVGGGGDGGGGGGPAGVLHKRITYPAVNVPGGRGTNMGMKNANVMMAQKPCSNCYITRFQAGLADMTGKQVNVPDGYWLHHMVLTNNTPSTPGLACGMEGFFTSGNERMAIDLSKSGNYGYPVRATDSWSMIEELANVTTTAKTMSVTVDFDYVPMAGAALRPAKPIWIGAAGCMGAYIPATPGVHTYNWTWTSSVAGKMIWAHTHTHDGSTEGTFAVNGRVFCHSEQLYGTTPESIEGPGTMMPGMAHISDVKGCQGTHDSPIATIKRGDRITSSVTYDSNKHMFMGTEPLMGIGHTWIDLNG